MSGFLFRILYAIVRAVMFFAHPVLRVRGRQYLPEGAAVICPNHSALSDPLWLIFAMKPRQMPRIMAKKELAKVPVIGPLLRWLGVIFVNRAAADVGAIKASLSVLKENQPLIIFPEGTRVKPGKDAPAHTGSALLASRTDAPLVPVYITRNKRFLGPIDVRFGEPFDVLRSGAKATSGELQAATNQLMSRIYALEET